MNFLRRYRPQRRRKIHPLVHPRTMRAVADRAKHRSELKRRYIREPVSSRSRELFSFGPSFTCESASSRKSRSSTMRDVKCAGVQPERWNNWNFQQNVKKMLQESDFLFFFFLFVEKVILNLLGWNVKSKFIFQAVIKYHLKIHFSLYFRLPHFFRRFFNFSELIAWKLYVMRIFTSWTVLFNNTEVFRLFLNFFLILLIVIPCNRSRLIVNVQVRFSVASINNRDQTK